MASSGKCQLSDKNVSLTAQQDGAVTRSSKTSNVEGTYPSGKSWQANGGPLSGIAPWPVAQIQQRQRIFSAFLNQKNIAALSNLQYSVLLHAITPIRSSKTAKPV